ncbi:MAG: alpha/beta hydrolase, partial [Bacteroidales bacterium]|nr:alpha/beta hydrolase [Bacteroidales bacterium]
MKRLIIFLLLFSSLISFSQSYSKNWKDINYAGDSMNYHKLDIYLPETVKQKYPVVISIYGSAWLANNAKGADLSTLGKALLEAGFAVVAPNHRSSMDAKFPAQINDIKAVIRFVRANAEKYQFDTSFVGITGSSSGGNLAAMAGTSGNIKAFTLGTATADIEGTIGNNAAFSSSVDAVVDWFGPTNMLVMDSCGGTDFIHNDVKSPASLYIGGPIQENKDKTLLASPITYIDENDPPFLIFHGDKDRVVPHCQSVIFYETLKNAKVACQFVSVPGGGHGPGVQIEQNLKMMTGFFIREMNRKNKIYHTGAYRNLFLEAGYSQAEIDKKVEKAYT